jgi:hypothetical protein
MGKKNTKNVSSRDDNYLSTRILFVYSTAAVQIRDVYDITQKYHARSYSRQQLFAAIQKRQI